MKKEIIYGIHPVLEALKAGRRKLFEILIVKEKSLSSLNKIYVFAKRAKINIKKVEKKHLDLIANTDQHQGVCAATSSYPFIHFSDITKPSNSSDTSLFLLLLDNIQDPHNLGAIIRTALCSGVDGIIIPKNRAAPPTSAVSKASAGALEHMRIARVVNIARTAQDLKKMGLWIFGLDMGGDLSVFSADFSDRTAIIIGGEQRGIRPVVKKQCDFLISIPQKGEINSLNASVAGGIIMYERFRQQHLKR